MKTKKLKLTLQEKEKSERERKFEERFSSENNCLMEIILEMKGELFKLSEIIRSIEEEIWGGIGITDRKEEEDE